MITDLLINILLFVPVNLLKLIPDLTFDLNFDADMFESFKDMVVCLDYVLPISVLLGCFAVKIAVRVWQLPYAILIRIKSFIPTMGG